MTKPNVQALALQYFDIPNTEDCHIDAAQAVDKWKLCPNRTRRALVILSYGHVHQDHYGPAPTFTVKSFTPGKDYTVDPTNHTCECKDFTAGGQICKHRIAVYLYTQRLERNKTRKIETVF